MKKEEEDQDEQMELFDDYEIDNDELVELPSEVQDAIYEVRGQWID